MKGEICVSGYRKFKLIYGVIAALLSFVAGMIYLIISHAEHAGYVKTEAVVVSLGKSNGDDTVTYRYTVNDETIDGTLKFIVPTNKHVGDHVKVRYDPKNPTKLENRSDETMWLILVLGFGVTAVILTLIWIRSRR